MLRFALAVLALLFATLPAAAQNIMDPFNIPQAMDDAAVLGQGVPYADGDRMKLDIYGPKDPKGPAPVVMFIYGGAWNKGARADYQFVGRALAANGFVAVIPDYRLYPDVTYPQFLEDNASAVKWIEGHIGSYGGDTSRFFILGHSAGAYAAYSVASAEPTRVAAVVGAAVTTAVGAGVAVAAALRFNTTPCTVPLTSTSTSVISVLCCSIRSRCPNCAPT